MERLHTVDHSRSHYSILLHKHQRQPKLIADSGALQPRPHASHVPTPSGRSFTRSTLRAIVLAVVVALATGVALTGGSTMAGGQVTTMSSVESNAVEDGLPVPIQLAQALTTALNDHDVDALVDLFTEEDSGPTVNADHHAWQKFEIRQWARQQVSDFDGTSSSDPDAGDTLTYAWDFNADGATDSTSATASYTYASAGSIAATLTVTDTRGVWNTASATITPGNTPPLANIASPAPRARGASATRSASRARRPISNRARCPRRCCHGR
jgi:PKD domain